MAREILKALKEARRVWRSGNEKGIDEIGGKVVAPPAPAKNSPVNSLKWSSVLFQNGSRPQPTAIEAELKNHWAVRSMELLLGGKGPQVLVLEARSPYLPKGEPTRKEGHRLVLAPESEREYLLTSHDLLWNALKPKQYSLRVPAEQARESQQIVNILKSGRQVGTATLHRVAGQRFLVSLSVTGREHFAPIINALFATRRAFSKKSATKK